MVLHDVVGHLYSFLFSLSVFLNSWGISNYSHLSHLCLSLMSLFRAGPIKSVFLIFLESLRPQY